MARIDNCCIIIVVIDQVFAAPLPEQGEHEASNLFGGVSLEECLKSTNGRPSGFDYLRLGLAVSVVVVHSASTTYGVDPSTYGQVDLWADALLRPCHRAILPMFFALSGFLVAGSLERSKTLLTFLSLRVIRIYPALAVEVVLSAFLIGAAVTAFPLESYFRDPMFLNYLRNAIGDIHYFLPGVFENNPWPRMVNFQLWTVPYELLSYAGLTILVVLGGVRRRIQIPLAALGLALTHCLLRLRKYGWELPNIDGHFAGPLLVMCFLAGLSLYLYRGKIAWSHHRMFAGTLIASVPLLWFGRYWDYPAILTVSEITIVF